MRWTTCALLLSGCQIENNEKIVYTDPEVTILSPDDGALVAEGMPVTFVALLEPKDARLDLEDEHDWVWTSSLAGDLGGTSTFDEDERLAIFEADPLEAGTHTVTVLVEPRSGRETSDSVTIEVVPNTAPTLSILSPEDGAAVESGEDVAILVEVADDTEPDLTDLTLSWSLTWEGAAQDLSAAPANPDEEGSAGFTLEAPANGAWVLSVSVVDSLGLSAEASSAFTVADPDADGDGYINEVFGGDDCNDSDPDVNPGAEEICDDLIDNDCDGEADECGLAGDHDLADAELVILGDQAGGMLGGAVSSGDLNGDGALDLAIGAAEADARTGMLYTIYGPIEEAVWLISDVADATITGGASATRAGAAIAADGDIDGDGIADLAYGSPYAEGLDAEGKTVNDAGSASVVLSTTGGTLSWLGGEENGFLGTTLAAVDLSADGVAELVMAAPYKGSEERENNRGYVYLTYGAPADLPVEEAGGLVLFGEQNGDLLGTAIAGAGDVNADGYGDLLVSAPGNSGGADDGGAVYLILGADALSGTQDVTSYAALTITGEAGAGLGSAVAGGGDILGEGYSALVLGASGQKSELGSGSNYGAVFAFLDAATLSGAVTTSSAEVGVFGVESGDRLGCAVAAGDVTGDGWADLLMGANGYGPSSTDDGLAVFWERPSDGPAPDGAVTLDSADARFLEDTNGAKAGAALTLAFENTGDGRQELTIGAPELGDETVSSGGAVFVFRGREL